MECLLMCVYGSMRLTRQNKGSGLRPWLSQQGHVHCTPEGQLIMQCKQMWWVQTCCDQLYAEFSVACIQMGVCKKKIK